MQSYMYEDQQSGQVDAQNVQRKPSKKSKKAASAFKTISEVAELLNVQQHVLRFWETKFSQVRPLKRGGGRRYYRPEDVELLQSIHHLLYTEGYTIKGVQRLLKEQGKNKVVQSNKPATTAQTSIPKPSPAQTGASDTSSILSQKNRAMLEDALADLRAMKAMMVG